MTESFVVDSSVTVSWVVESQADSEANKLRDAAASGMLIVPALWAFEVANTLLTLKKRRKLAEEDYEDAGHWLSGLRPSVDEFHAQLIFGRISELAFAQSLTVYDATYLELALRRRLPLASRDVALNQAARRAGVETLL